MDSKCDDDDDNNNNLNDIVYVNERFISMASGYFNLIAIPLLIISGLAIGFILVWAEDILVPFVIAVFFTYLLRPLVDLLSMPIGKCSRSFSQRKKKIRNFLSNSMYVRRRLISFVSIGRSKNSNNALLSSSVSTVPTQGLGDFNSKILFLFYLPFSLAKYLI